MFFYGAIEEFVCLIALNGVNDLATIIDPANLDLRM
jgi:hypothetical protein